MTIKLTYSDIGTWLDVIDSNGDEVCSFKLNSLTHAQIDKIVKLAELDKLDEILELWHNS